MVRMVRVHCRLCYFSRKVSQFGSDQHPSSSLCWRRRMGSFAIFFHKAAKYCRVVLWRYMRTHCHYTCGWICSSLGFFTYRILWRNLVLYFLSCEGHLFWWIGWYIGRVRMSRYRCDLGRNRNWSFRLTRLGGRCWRSFLWKRKVVWGECFGCVGCLCLCVLHDLAFILPDWVGNKPKS